MGEIRMLTVRQPWAWAIAHGYKTVENRSQPTPYRGLVAIHAGQRYDKGADQEPLVEDAMRQWVGHGFLHGVPPWQQGGSIIAVTELVGVCSASALSSHVRCDCGPWAWERSHHWKLNATVPIEHLPAKGWLRLRPLPEETSAEVERRWGVALARKVGLPIRTPVSDLT